MEKRTLQVMEEHLSFGDELTNDEVLAATGGTKSTYTGKWQVIGLENGKLKLVSVKNVGDVTLGYNDPNAIGSSEFEKALDSYKKAVTTLNNVAKSNTGISTARSITVKDIYNMVGKEEGQSKQYTFYYNTYYEKVALQERISTTSKYTSQTFIDKTGTTVTIDSEGEEVVIEDNNYEDASLINKQQKDEAGSLIKGKKFVIASKCVDVDINNCEAHFGYREMQYTYITHIRLVSSTGGSYNKEEGVRAIVYI